jgi:signal transduction histidine kinase
LQKYDLVAGEDRSVFLNNHPMQPGKTPFCQKQAGCPLAEHPGSFEQYQDTLIRQERLAALGQLAASLAHEIRNPLTSIRGFCQLLDAQLTDERCRSYLKILVHEVDRMNGLIAEFMALAQPCVPKILPLDLNELLRETLAMTDSRCFLNQIRVKVHTGKTPPVRADRDKIKQVLLNLINNAIEAMEHQEREKVLTASTEADNQAVRLIIADTGCGIPEDMLENIGRPFFSTKNTGTGLGLFICQRIAKEFGGAIYLESHAGSGTRATLSLPLTTA